MQINPETGYPYLTLDLIRTILLEELDVEPETIAIYNQKFNLPKGQKMYIYIEPKSPPVLISNRNQLDALANENQDSSWMEEIAVEIYSRSLEALNRKEEVVMALFSMYSQQLQEAQSFKIARNPRVIPINEIEGTARLYRFDIECRVFSWYNKIKAQPKGYFDEFPMEVWANRGLSYEDIEFIIPALAP